MHIIIPKSAFNFRVLPPSHGRTATATCCLYGGRWCSGKSVFAVQRYPLPAADAAPVQPFGGAGGGGHQPGQHLRPVPPGDFRRWGLSALFACKESDLRITCANGNSVIFKGLDDTEKLKSVTFPKGELTDIWVEEASEMREEDFNQLDVRLRGKGTHKQMVLTFNPVSVLHWLKRRFFDRQDPRALVVKSTYKDNCFLDEDYKAHLGELQSH